MKLVNNYFGYEDRYALLKNFSEEGVKDDDVASLAGEETDKVADLMTVIKPDALNDDGAIKDIANATDVDESVVKNVASVKDASDETSDEQGIEDRESREEFFFSNYMELKNEIVGECLAFFSEQGMPLLGFLSQRFFDEEEGATQDEGADNAEALKIVKYVDEGAIQDKGADEVAEIIATATDGDVDIIKDAVESKMESFANGVRWAAYNFSLEANNLSAAASSISEDSISGLMNQLESIKTDTENRIESGESWVKNTLQGQDEGDSALTNTDPLSGENLPENLPSHILSQTKNSINLGTPGSSQPAPQTQTANNFSDIVTMIKDAEKRSNPMYNAFGHNFNSKLELGQGDAVGALKLLNQIPTTFSDSNSQAMQDMSAVLNLANMVKD